MKEFTKRYGNFTSSDIYRLMGIGSRDMTPDEKSDYKKNNPKSYKKTIEDINILTDVAINYIIEKNTERRLGKSISTESNAKPLVWGKFCEKQVFKLIGSVYELVSTDTITHAQHNFWKGTPDGLSSDTVIDLKCPWTIESFVKLVQPLYDGLDGIEAMNAIRYGYTDNTGLFHSKHKDGEKFYWQLVSNSILTKREYAELIVFIPYESELEYIQEQADGVEDAYFISFAKENELPYIKNNGYYSNLNVIRFRVPESDKELLQRKVEIAGELLIDYYNNLKKKKI